MRILITILLILGNFILETTLLPYLAVRGVVPHTALLIAVSYALLRGRKEGAIVGFFSGLLFDIFFGTLMGYHAVLLMGIAYLFGRYQKHFYRENYLLPILFCILAAILYETFCLLTTQLAQGEIYLFYFLLRILLPQIVYTAAITIPLYRLLFGLNEWIELKEKYKYRLF